MHQMTDSEETASHTRSLENSSLKENRSRSRSPTQAEYATKLQPLKFAEQSKLISHHSKHISKQKLENASCKSKLPKGKFSTGFLHYNGMEVEQQSRSEVPDVTAYRYKLSKQPKKPTSKFSKYLRLLKKLESRRLDRSLNLQPSRASKVEERAEKLSNDVVIDAQEKSGVISNKEKNTSANDVVLAHIEERVQCLEKLCTLSPSAASLLYSLKETAGKLGDIRNRDPTIFQENHASDLEQIRMEIPKLEMLFTSSVSQIRAMFRQLNQSNN